MEKIVKRMGVVIVLALCALFILRCCMVADKSTFSDLSATDALREAFADGESEVYSVHVAKELSEDGYFAAYAFYYSPESGEVQLGVRWNDSAYDYTDVPEGTEYAFRLLDEKTGETYPLEAVDAKKKSIYNYRKLIGEGISFDSDAQLTVLMDINESYSSRQIVKADEQVMEIYKVPRKIIASLEE